MTQCHDFLQEQIVLSLCVHLSCFCKMGGIVGGDEGPVSGVAQVDCHGVKVVGAHGEEGQEEDGEVR